MERNDAMVKAQEYLVDFLKADRPSDYWSLEDRELVKMLEDLRSQRDEMLRLSASMRRDMEHADEYIRGGEGRFNSLGILQSSAQRYDSLASQFYLVAGYVKVALVKHFEGSACDVTRSDLAAAAETIETFASIDEGEHTDSDLLNSLAERLRDAAKS